MTLLPISSHVKEPSALLTIQVDRENLKGNVTYAITQELEGRDYIKKKKKKMAFYSRLRVLIHMKRSLRKNNIVYKATQDFSGGSEVKASAGNVGVPGSIPGLGRPPGEGNGNPLQYSCLENPMDRGALWAPWGRKESDTTERLTHTQERTQHSKATILQ